MQAPENSREHVGQSDHEQYWAGKQEDSCDQQSEDHDEPKRLARPQIDVLETVEAPGAEYPAGLELTLHELKTQLILQAKGEP